ncbi:hypothetical protein HXX76_012080 [Chlamydomonas incerta]|uniref:Uncharacterized protein n=1 Tax=Chlamydomonas incerta TaxID=51695 RepID=A0A835SVW2_CHLIN|nr:hypothetical protein HXX76_012080 [Chlamydomonas incerta]|eukprot:KAG2427755.1 hypothetical protein HXX76_012080 [Chlamydomonas incerta]
MLGAQPEVRAKAAAGVAGGAADGASDYAVLGAGGGDGQGGKAGDGGGGGPGGDGGHQGSHDDNSFPRTAPLLLAALAALACAASLAAHRLHTTQKSTQWQSPQRVPATRTRVLFSTTAGGSSSRLRRSGAGAGAGRGLPGAWSSWLPRYPDPVTEGSSGSGEPEEPGLATSRMLQPHPWSAGEPHHGFWRDERAAGGAGGGWARQGLSQAGSGTSSRQRSDSGAYGADAGGPGGAEPGLWLPTSGAAASRPEGLPGSGARSLGPRDPRVDFGDEISRLGSARDGLHAAHGRANKWLQADAARRGGSSSTPAAAMA